MVAAAKPIPGSAAAWSRPHVSHSQTIMSSPRQLLSGAVVTWYFNVPKLVLDASLLDSWPGFVHRNNSTYLSAPDGMPAS